MDQSYFGQWLGTASLWGITVVISGCGTRPVGREVPPDRFCEIKLEWLAKAVADYRSEHGELPQARTDYQGLRQSWRVLLAPYILAHTYHPGTFKYRLEEAWDSPYNRNAFQNSWLAGCLTCPAEKQSVDYPFVSYVMLLRPRLEGSDEVAHPRTGLPDDAVLFVESTGCRIEYGEPRDIDIEALFRGDSPFGVGKLNSLHPEVVKALRVDGKVIDIPKDIAKKALQKLLAGTTTNGTR